MSIGTYKIRIAWSGLSDFSGAFDDVTLDVLSIKYRLGFTRLWDRTATVGKGSLLLHNSASNNNAEWGLYSPDNTSSSLAGLLKPWRITDIACNFASTDYTLFSGYVTHIIPLIDRDLVQVKFADSLYPYSLHKVSMNIMQDVRSDQVIEQIVDDVFIPRATGGFWLIGIPGASEVGNTAVLADAKQGKTFDTGFQDFKYAAHTWASGRVSALRAIGDICKAEWGRFWADRTGELRFWNQYQQYNTTTLQTTIATGAFRLRLARFAEFVKNKIRVSVQPIGFTGTTVQLAAAQTRIRVDAGKSTTLNLSLSDPGTGIRVNGLSIVSPVLNTDYTVQFARGPLGEHPSGGWSPFPGQDPETDISVVATLLGDVVQLVFSNANAGIDIDVIDFVIRGQGAILYDAQEFESEDQQAQLDFTGGQATEVRIALNHGKNYLFAERLADHLLEIWKAPITGINLTLQNSSDAIYTQMLARTIMEVVKVTETTSGIDNEFFLLAEEHTIRAARHQVKWLLEPRDVTQYWRLGIATESEIGQTTNLGPM